MTMRGLSLKIAKETENSNRLRKLTMNEEVNFEKAMDIYGQINKINNKIEFLQNLSKALKKQEGKDENKVG